MSPEFSELSYTNASEFTLLIYRDDHIIKACEVLVHNDSEMESSKMQFEYM